MNPGRKPKKDAQIEANRGRNGSKSGVVKVDAVDLGELNKTIVSKIEQAYPKIFDGILYALDEVHRRFRFSKQINEPIPTREVLDAMQILEKAQKCVGAMPPETMIQIHGSPDDFEISYTGLANQIRAKKQLMTKKNPRESSGLHGLHPSEEDERQIEDPEDSF